jgi:transposase
LPHAGGVQRQLATAETAIRDAVKAQPDATLQELCERVEQATKVKSDPSMMCRELARLHLPLKKSRSMRASGRHLA